MLKIHDYAPPSQKQTNKKAKRENTFFTALINQFQTFKLE